MNSLNYLSRSFDVIVSTSGARAPPSTPVDESEKRLTRTKSWSAKSLFFPPRPPPSPKRSFSSPALSAASNPPAPTPTAVPFPTVSAMPHPTLAGDTPVISHRRSIIERILVLAWKVLCAAWDSLSGSHLPRQVPVPTIAPPTPPTEKAPHAGSPTVPPRPPSHDPMESPRSPRIFALGDHRSQTEPVIPPNMMRSTTSSQLSVPNDTGSSSRASTPGLSQRKSPFHLPKTLVLDLDETLIHSTSRPIQGIGSRGFFGFGRKDKGAGHLVEVVLGGRSTLYHVYKRPFADFFLRTVSSWYTLVIFTASMQEYADPVIDWLDAGRGILARRLFRDSCTQLPNGSYTKDLSVIEDDLSRVCLVDNSPISYRVNEANGIPIEGWTHDPSDEALLDLLPVLDSLRFTSDVRHILGLRGAGANVYS